MSLHGFLRIVNPASDTLHILRPGDRSLIKVFPREPKPFPMHLAGMAASGEETGRPLLRDAAMLGMLLTFGPRVSNQRRPDQVTPDTELRCR
ncbi:hypothetical protein [Rhodovarius lipocyclicus]|uniref:hypothetical protein n=1 Tax=Rhodovarius lipocyclicus TaxID=268410 RepID=UPI0013574EE4|nr:hypothetical protein [Rhodovarius lipocyclicus]